MMALRIRSEVVGAVAVGVLWALLVHLLAL